MILKHRDTEVLRFDWVKPFGVKNVEVNSVAERFLPLSFRERVRNWLDIPGGVTDAQIERLRGLENFSFTPHPEFTWPDNRLEVSQYFLRNRIAKIIQYREKADDFIKLPLKDGTINRIKKEVAQTGDLKVDLLNLLKLFPTENGGTENFQLGTK